MSKIMVFCFFNVDHLLLMIDDYILAAGSHLFKLLMLMLDGGDARRYYRNERAHDEIFRATCVGRQLSMSDRHRKQDDSGFVNGAELAAGGRFGPVR
jgi:hypothetical protein